MRCFSSDILDIISMLSTSRTAFIQVLERESTTAGKKLAGEVEFCNVSYRYQDTSPWVLKDISLKVRPGETVALVGPSGGGKTTLAKLLLRLYDPIQGMIFDLGQFIIAESYMHMDRGSLFLKICFRMFVCTRFQLAYLI